MNAIELLAPAGSREALVAALDAGADAVYLGGAFGARAYAKNFSRERLVEAVSYAHERNRKVYLTLNTLLLEGERDAFLDQARWAARAGVDAALVQDIAVLALLRAALPGLPLHASTQMGIHNAQGATWAARQGLSRVVLARECPLDEIAAIHKSVSGADGFAVGDAKGNAIDDSGNATDAIELEVFAHGALCASMSGQCLMSSIAGGRSGNRGRCAQPCRLPYTLEGAIKAQGDLLSPRDLCLIEHIEDLRQAGVSCIKIEGRMKSPEYVATVTGIYRRALDGLSVSKEDVARLQGAFRRRGYGKGFLFGGDDARHLAVFVKEGPEADEASPTAYEPRRVGVALRFLARIGEPLRLTVFDGERSAEADGITAEVPRSAPLTREAIERSLRKMGDTPYEVASIEIDAEPFFAPVSALNELRRAALDLLANARIEAMRAWPIPEWVRTDGIPLRTVGLDATPHAVRAARVVVQASGEQAVAALQAGAEVFWQPDDWRPAALTAALGLLPEDAQTSLWLSPPPFLPTKTLETIRHWATHHARRFAGYVAANPAHIGMLPWEMRAGAPLHSLSADAAIAWMQLGFTDITISHEANRSAAQAIARAVPAILPAQGRLPLMLLRHCPYRAAKGVSGGREGCTHCRDGALHGMLRDRTGRRFSLRRYAYENGCMQRVLNADILRLDRHRLPEASPLLIFWDEAPGFVALSVRIWQAKLAGESPTPEDRDAWDDAWSGVRATAGHWLRGVE